MRPYLSPASRTSGRAALIAALAVSGAGVLPVVGSGDLASQSPDSPGSVRVAATHTGPRGAVHFCLAPPAPPRRKPPPVPEFAPRLRELRLGPDAARRGFEAPDTARVLFLLAEFADVPFDTAGIDTTGRADPDASTLLVDYFERQLEYIREYYLDVSYGRMIFEPVVLDRVIALPFRMRYYGVDERFGERGTKLIWDAVLGADDVIDFGAYSGMAVIHSGAGQESDINNNSKAQIWSAFFPQPFVSEVMTDSLGYEVPGIPTNDLTAEGDTVYVEAAAIVPEIESQDGFEFGIMGVYTHELGHVIAGWPDLYDTTPEDPSQGPGAFCLMAAGTWNANGNVPAEPSAWCRMYAGWVEPVLVETAPGTGQLVRIKHVERDALAPDDTVLVRVPISGDEYFLIENRQPDLDDDAFFDWTGADGEPGESFSFWTDSYAGAEFDYFTPNQIPSSPQPIYREAEGLYIWHVDESTVTFGFPFNLVNADPHHQGIDLEEADGVQDLEFALYTILSFGSPDDAFRKGNATELTPESDPSTRTTFGGVSGVEITEIGAADSIMTFRVAFRTGDGSGAEPVVRDGWPVRLPDVAPHAQPLVANLDGDPEEELVVLGSFGTLRIFDPSGSPDLVGLSIGEEPAGSALAGDTDGDGDTDLVVVGASGGVYRFPGPEPARAGGLYAATDSIGFIEGALVNIDGDAALELVIGSTDAGPDSTDARIWLIDFEDGLEPARRFGLEAALTSAPAAMSSGGGALIVHPVATGGLLALLYDGAAALTSGPVVESEVIFSHPAIADLDADGSFEVLVVGSDGTLALFDLVGDMDLEMADGWPVQIFATPGGGASAVDVNADGVLEVLAIGTGGSVHALNYNGVPLQGWPKRLDTPLDTFFDFQPPHPAPLAADVTGNGRLDLIAAFGDGRAMALELGRGAARVKRGWPVQTTPGSVPVVGDFDGDGLTDVFAVEAAVGIDGTPLWTRATMWSLGTPYTARADGWRMHRRDPRRSALAGASPDVASRGPDLLADVYCQPNPAYRDGTSIHYRLDGTADRVDVRLYDVSGREVRRLAGAAFDGVDNLVRWDGTNDEGQLVAPGLYVYRVTARGETRTQSVVGKVAFVR